MTGIWDFSEFIHEHGFIDLPMEGGVYSWSNNHDPPSTTRLERFLVSPNWVEHFTTRVIGYFKDHYQIIFLFYLITMVSRGENYFNFLKLMGELS